MSDQSNAVEGLGGDTALKRLLIALCSISTLGMGCWVWLQHNRPLLPLPDSKAGRALLRQYQGLTHDIWLIFLLLAVGGISDQQGLRQQTTRGSQKRSHFSTTGGIVPAVPSQQPRHNSPAHRLHRGDDFRDDISLQRYARLVSRLG